MYGTILIQPFLYLNTGTQDLIKQMTVIIFAHKENKNIGIIKCVDCDFFVHTVFVASKLTNESRTLTRILFLLTESGVGFRSRGGFYKISCGSRYKTLVRTGRTDYILQTQMVLILPHFKK